MIRTGARPRVAGVGDQAAHALERSGHTDHLGRREEAPVGQHGAGLALGEHDLTHTIQGA